MMVEGKKRREKGIVREKREVTKVEDESVKVISFV